MANVPTLQRSFSGGEVSPEMFGRSDDAKYQSGLARCRNFITKPQGPAENRPGFAFVREVKKNPSYKFTPVIMLTTEAAEEKKRLGQEAGARAWVVKPFQPQQMLAAVSKLVM